jgi:GntR family transcriptional regulator
MIKRSPSLTDQVKTHIKEQIWANAYEDDRVPAETDLANELGVSRTTVRDALSRLENEGVVVRKQGAGTFINRPGLQIKSRLDEIWSYEAALEAHGYLPSTRLLDVRLEAATAEIANDLALASGDQILVVKKLFLEDQQPVILAINLIPQQRISKPYTDSDLVAPIFEFLAESGDQHLSYYLTDIVPAVASDDVAQALQVPAGTPLITLEEVGYNEENEPILKAYSYFRDDLLRMRLIRRKV